MTDDELREIEEIKKWAPTNVVLDDKLKQEILKSYENNEEQYNEEKHFFNNYKGQYFGRMDFDIEFYNEDKKNLFLNHYYDKLYIGDETIYDKDDKIVIISWKDPVGNFYYEDKKRILNVDAHNDYTYNHCVNNYELMLKRRFNKGNKLDYQNVYIQGNTLYDNGDVDAFLMKILTRLRQEQTKQAVSIVETLQQDQFEIIKSDLKKSFYVQGCAGSGKTMVLMHRLSYLLYNNKYLNTSSIKIISPNENLIDQMQDLSINLKISNIKQLTIEKYYLHLISNLSKDVFKEFSKSLILSESDIDTKIITYIYSDEFKKIIDNNYKEYIFNTVAKKIKKDSSTINLKDYNYNELTKNDINISDLSLVKEVIKSSLKNVYTNINTINPLYRHTLYLTTYILSKFYEKKDIDFMLNIDEAQDIALNEYRLIKYLNPNAIFNLYGDTNQLLIKGKGIPDWKILDEFNLNSYSLNVNYRNIKQITNFCKKVLPNVNMLPMGINGEQVEYLEDDDELEIYIYNNEDDDYYDVDDISEEDISQKINFAIIVKNKKIATKFLHEFNFDLNEFNIIENKNNTINKNKINIFTVEMSKGMEFSKTLVINKQMKEREKYIAYTRALNMLKIFDENRL